MINSLFPLFYYHGRVKNHKKLKKSFLSEISDEKLITPQNWNCTLQTSFGSIFKEDFPWNSFIQSVGPNVLELHKQLGGDPDVSLSIIDAWVNQYNAGDSQEIHNHLVNNSTFSCCYFLKYDKDLDSKFVFRNTNLELEIGSLNSLYNISSTHTPEVCEGDIIIFPSSIHHFVEIQKNNSNRTTVSANFQLTSVKRSSRAKLPL
tara:strand:- start:13 stop:624 length:612 start_codon:yes stop_codon:yes gene_type:complete